MIKRNYSALHVDVQNYEKHLYVLCDLLVKVGIVNNLRLVGQTKLNLVNQNRQIRAQSKN